MKMKKSRTILSVILFISVVIVAPIQVGAQSYTAVRAVYSLDIKGNVEEYLEAMKPVIARFNEIQSKSKLRIYQAEFAGSNTGGIDIVIDHPSMAYMEEMRPKFESDEELAKLWPTLEKFGITVVSSGLHSNRAPEQDRDFDSPIVSLYAIDTHGNNDAYVEGSKKIHERYYKVIKNASVSVYEAMFTGESTGRIYIIVGVENMAAIDKNEEKIANDEELTRLFAERDKIGAAIVSLSLLRDVTP
jgi:hypothetical protein